MALRDPCGGHSHWAWVFLWLLAEASVFTIPTVTSEVASCSTYKMDTSYFSSLGQGEKGQIGSPAVHSLGSVLYLFPIRQSLPFPMHFSQHCVMNIFKHG